MNGPRMGHLDPPFVDCHPPHINSFFVQFLRDGTHTCIWCWCSTPINKWMLLDLIYTPWIFIHQMNGADSHTRLHCDSKTTFMSLQISGFTIHMFYLPEWHQIGDQKDHVWPGPQRAPKKIKKGRQNEISTTCWLFLNARWPMGVEKCMVWGWPLLVVLSGLLVARTKRMKLMQRFFIKNCWKVRFFSYKLRAR